MSLSTLTSLDIRVDNSLSVEVLADLLAKNSLTSLGVRIGPACASHVAAALAHAQLPALHTLRLHWSRKIIRVQSHEVTPLLTKLSAQLQRLSLVHNIPFFFVPAQYSLPTTPALFGTKHTAI